jgi:hypothetical protein
LIAFFKKARRVTAFIKITSFCLRKGMDDPVKPGRTVAAAIIAITRGNSGG